MPIMGATDCLFKFLVSFISELYDFMLLNLISVKMLSSESKVHLFILDEKALYSLLYSFMNIG